MEDLKNVKPVISFDDFAKLDIRVGTILACEPIEGSEKLYRLEVDFGIEKRQILSGIKKYCTPEDLIGRQCMFVYNLAPRMMMGHESQGMIIAAHGDGGSAVLYKLDKQVENGSVVS